MTTIHFESLIRVGEAARILGVSPQTMRIWEAERRFLPIVRTEDGLRLYCRWAVDKFAAERKHGKHGRQ